MGPDSVAIPGLVNCYSRQGMDSRAGNGSEPGLQASDELYPQFRDYPELLEAGITTLALYPAGNGIPGRAVAVRPKGGTPEEMTLADDVYLKIRLRSNSSSKKMISDGFKEADGYIEKEKKAREKWEKDKEKEEKAKKKKKDDEKDEEVKEVGPYVPPEPDGKAAAFQALRDRELRALIAISSAGDYIHLLDAIGEEEFDWDLRIPVSRALNLFEIKREIGLAECRVVMEPTLSQHPDTLRARNIPKELSDEGAKLVLIPRSDHLSVQKHWLHHAGEIIGAGLSRDVALRAMTLEPAEMIGLGERLGSLSAGKDANIVLLNGDPFEPGTQIEAVILEGEIVSGEVN
jgi:hypothetical protein